MLTILTLMALSILFYQPEPTLPPDAETAAAKDWLTKVQRLSFATDREYCGYMGYTANGALAFTEIVRGGHNGCTPAMPEGGLTLVASLHTHGSYDREVPAEFPTTLDIDSDTREGVNGYISTPGGRLWYIDSSAQIATQLCGLQCLPQDPEFHAGDDGVIHRSYTRAQLLRIETPD